ncbi:MAG: ABC transporter permease subunit [Bryobacterales bacterium]|nr:ABC transporter permease subunit [Bryobacterales bacterium]
MNPRNTWIICQKELKGYFASPIAYGLMAFFALICGYFFYAAVGWFVFQSTQQMMMRGGAMPMDVADYVVRPVMGNVSVIGLFLIPMITMRLFAEEKRAGTMELLATSPVRDTEIVVGKWLAAVILYLAMLGIAALNLAILFLYSKPEVMPILISFLGLALQGAGLLALGAFISNLTRNQIIAGAGTFAICLLLWVIGWTSEYEQTTFSKVLAYISVTTHFENFAKGVLDTKDVIFYLSVIFFGLFLTVRSMESLRWRA